MQVERDYTFVNWAGNVRQQVRNYFQPETLEEIVDIVRHHQHIRMVGTGHSWSDICVNGEAMLNLDKFNKILEVDHERLQIKVQAGIKLWELNEQLDKIGLALINLGSIARQSIAGAISTGTHGSGINYQIIGSAATSLTIIDANGNIHHMDKEQQPDMFHAAIVNLGCLGILAEITLKVTKAFNLNDHTVAMPMDDVLDKLDDFVLNTDHFKMWWLAPAKYIVTYRYNRTQKPTNDSAFRQWFKDVFLSVTIYRFLVWVAKWIPGLADFFNTILTSSYKKPLNRIEKSYKVFNVPEPPLHRETEWAFDYKDAPAILKEYKKLLKESGFHYNFIQEIRFTKGDDFWLSPCYHRDSIWLGVYCYEHEHWDKVLPMFEAFARKHNGRPHWGKEFVTTDKGYLQQVYEKWDDFIQIKQSFDPNGKFSNAFTSKLFDR